MQDGMSRSMTTSRPAKEPPIGDTSGTDLSISRARIDRELRSVLVEILGIDPEEAADLGPDSGLFGHLPELDSMAVAGLLTEVEDRFNIVIDDDEVEGEMLETYGGLLSFVEAKVVTS